MIWKFSVWSLHGIISIIKWQSILSLISNMMLCWCHWFHLWEILWWIYYHWSVLLQTDFLLHLTSHTSPLMLFYFEKSILVKQINNSIYIQWNLANPTHQGIREMCRIVQDVGKLGFSFYLTEIYTNLTREEIAYVWLCRIV